MEMSLREIAALALDEWEGESEKKIGNPQGAAATLQFNLQQHLDQYHGGQQPKGECKYMDKVAQQAKALGVADKVPGLNGGEGEGKSVDDTEVKNSAEWKQYITDRQVQDATFTEKLKAMGVENPQLNGSGYTEEQMKVVDEWHKAIDDRRDKYLKEALGDAEAHCVEQLADIIDAGGEKAEKALKLAEDIAEKYGEGDPCHIGAEKMKDRAERRKQKEEFDKRQAEQDARQKEQDEREKQLKEREAALGKESKAGVEGEGGEGNGNLGEVQVGNKTYVDLSGKGFWEGMAEAFKAGFNGKEIITDWDKMSGRWDKIRQGMTEKQRAAFDGLSNGLADALQKKANSAAAAQFEKHLADDSGLTDEQKAYVQQLYADWASNDKNKAKMLKELNRYLNEQGIGDENKKKENEGYGTGGFSSVTSNATASVPKTDILKPVPNFVSDQTAQKKTAKDIEAALQHVGLDIISDEDSLIDGPSRFSIEYKYGNSNPDAIKAAFAREAKRLGIKNYTFEDVVEGKPETVRITVNKANRRPASFRALMEHPKTQKQIAKMSIPMQIGETMDGSPIWGDFIDHGLLGGTTGSGKTTSLNSGIGSLFMARSPKQVRVLINDAAKKGQDLGKWNGDKHMLGDVATTEEDVVKNLQTMCDEIDRRAELLHGKSLAQYNAEQKAQGKEELPYILGITDEMTDLFDKDEYGAQAKKLIAKIVRKGRSLGVAHLGATQRPSAANTPKDTLGNNRVCLKMNTPEESNMVINGYRGGDKLQKHGDGMTNVGGDLVSMQAPLIDDDDIKAIRDYDWGGSGGGATTPTTASPSPSPKTGSGKTNLMNLPNNVKSVAEDDLGDLGLDFDKNYYFVHRTSDDAAKQIADNGFKAGADVSGTAMLATKPEQLKDMFDSQRSADQRGDWSDAVRGGSHAVILSVPKDYVKSAYPNADHITANQIADSFFDFYKGNVPPAKLSGVVEIKH